MESNLIGDKIAKARRKASLSQAQLAEQLFISAQAVGKWERGESIPDILTINKLAKILGLELNYFSDDFSSGEEITPGQKAPLFAEAGQITDDHSIPVPERALLTNFSGSELTASDFAGVTAHKRKFNGSALRGSDFSDADLSGSAFKASDLREAKFDRTNLSDCTLFAVDLKDASFNKTILLRTGFSTSDLTGAKFTDVNFIDTRLTAMDLHNSFFENCSFSGVHFKSSDLSGLCLDGLHFSDVMFDGTSLKGASFKGASFQNVSFRASFALTNKYFRAIKIVCFDDATMDKLTYAALKGMGADLSKVRVK